ncbi:MAG: type III secretion system export apparatus subunit SctT [Desulfobacterales bacterium]|nr:type III secretion system export apparatus subunit SctT [Desulfobacterales bacterium]
MILEFESFNHFFITVVYSTPRMMAVLFSLPFFSQKLLQKLIVNSIVFSFTLIVIPVVSDTLPKDSTAPLYMIGIITKEVIIGTIMGFLMSIFFKVAENVGFLIDNQRGAAAGNYIDPLTAEESSPTSSLFNQLVIILFFKSGGLLFLLSLIYKSYLIWPIFSVFPKLSPDFLKFFLSQLDLMNHYTILYAAPFLIILFLTEFGMGLVNRFTNQLNVFFLSMPIKSGLCSFIIIIYLAVLINLFDKHLFEIKTLFYNLKKLMK